MGKNTDFPTCKNCGEAHRLEPGRVCPKFRSPTRIPQPQPKLLAPPPKAPSAAPLALPAPVVTKKAKKAKKKAKKARKPKKKPPVITPPVPEA